MDIVPVYTIEEVVFEEDAKMQCNFKLKHRILLFGRDFDFCIWKCSDCFRLT